MAELSSATRCPRSKRNENHPPAPMEGRGVALSNACPARNTHTPAAVGHQGELKLKLACILTSESWRELVTVTPDTAPGCVSLVPARVTETRKPPAQAQGQGFYLQGNCSRARKSRGTRLAALFRPLRGPWWPYAPSGKNRICLEMELACTQPVIC